MMSVRRVSQGLLVASALGWAVDLLPGFVALAFGGTALLTTAATGALGLRAEGNVTLALLVTAVAWVSGVLSGGTALMLGLTAGVVMSLAASTETAPVDTDEEDRRC